MEYTLLTVAYRHRDGRAGIIGCLLETLCAWMLRTREETEIPAKIGAILEAKHMRPAAVAMDIQTWSLRRLLLLVPREDNDCVRSICDAIADIPGVLSAEGKDIPPIEWLPPDWCTIGTFLALSQVAEYSRVRSDGVMRSDPLRWTMLTEESESG